MGKRKKESKLALIIPHYKEEESVVKDLLDSIKIQQNVDFKDLEVIIVNDGSDVVLSDDLTTSYPFNITYVIKDHENVSMARNYGLELSKSQYVMFCDADDIFLSNIALFSVMNNNNPDIIVSPLLSEQIVKDSNKPIYILLNNDTVHLHGKAYKKSFLDKHNLRFKYDLTINEDGYFNYQALNLTNKIHSIEYPIFLWRRNKNSVTRSCKNFYVEKYSEMLYATDCLCQALFDRGLKQLSALFAAQAVYDLYFKMHDDDWYKEEYSKQYIEIKERFKKFFNKYKVFWDRMPEEARYRAYNECREKARKGSIFKKEKFLFEDWLDGMLK